ncbi:MAG: PKD domain-containing protein [Bacteroidia bacterium]|nr:PKD domain-containing protein [Bacteroidia bacterium]
MKQFVVYIFIVIVVLLGACKKTDYPKETRVDGNYFYSELNVNGNPLTLKAGENGYRMMASQDTSHVDSFNVSKYIGEFKQANCENCSNSIRIQINDSKLSGQGLSDVNQAIYPNTLSFFSASANLKYQVKFTGRYNGSASIVSWDFGDGSNSSLLNPTHFYEAGTYNVKLRIKGSNMCESVIEQSLSLGPNSLNAVVNSSANKRTITFNPVVYGGTAPYTYYWNFGDGRPDTVTTSTTTKHSYTYRGSYPVKLKVKDADGYLCYSNLNVVTADDSSGCASNFTYPKPAEIMLNYGSPNVSILFTDANGTSYSSDGGTQPQTSFLEILSVEEFQRNEKGEPVKRVRLKFDCIVYNGTKQINLKGKEVYIGFAYK